MCDNHGSHDPYKSFQAELIAAGLFIPSGVRGVFGLGGDFEKVLESFDALATEAGAGQKPEVMRFPPIFNRQHYLQNDHIETMPDLLGSVHSFVGDERKHRQMLEKVEAKDAGWTDFLSASEVMMVPAVCYPLYPTAKGTLGPNGRTVDLRGFVFRHEPSDDPARMQVFRMHEYVRIGSPEQALAHRQYWIENASKLLREVGLDVKVEVANDPFFGRGGKVMKVSQREQELKFELTYPICSEEKPTAITSCNYHQDHFGVKYEIFQANGQPAHSACMGFGLERITLALFKTHGLNLSHWPSSVRQKLRLS